MDLATEKPNLTFKQQRFVDAYLNAARGNGTEAGRIAGYAKPSEQAYENLRKPQIRQAIDDYLFAHAMTAGEVLRGLSEHARGTVAHFLVGDGRDRLDLSTEEAGAHLHLIKKFKSKTKTTTRKRDAGEWEETDTDVETEIELELHDPQAALVQLGRHHKLFTDKHEMAGPGGGPIPIREIVIERQVPAEEEQDG